jgi:hypothetical protein
MRGQAYKYLTGGQAAVFELDGFTVSLYDLTDHILKGLAAGRKMRVSVEEVGR